MNVKQITLACSGPPLSSNVLNACIGSVAYVSTLLSLQQHGQTRPDKSSALYHYITGIERGVFRLVDQKWYAPRPSNFVNMWICCSGTFPFFRLFSKGNVGHVTAGKVMGDSSVQLYSGSVLIASIGGSFARRSCDEQY